VSGADNGLRLGHSRSGVGQAHWGLLDQGLSAGTNLLLAVVVARTVSSTEFGAFALVYAVFIVLVPLLRSTGPTVLAIEHAGSAGPALTAAVRGAAGYALGTGLLLGGAAAAVGVLVGGLLGPPLVVLGVTLPLLLLQDTWRGVFLAKGDPCSALRNDAVWVAVMLTLLAPMLLLHAEPPVWVFLAVWAAGGVAGAAFGARQLRLLPAVRLPHVWLREHRPLALPLLVAELLTQVPPHLAYVLLPLVADLHELGVLRASYLFFGPLGLLYQGLGALALPDAVRASDPRRTHRLALRLTAALMTVAVAWGIAVVLCPDSVGRAVVGEAWEGSQTTRLLLAVSLVAEAALVGPRVVLSARRLPGRLLLGRLYGGPVLLVTAIVLGAVHGAPGAAAGFVLGYLTAAAVSWWQVLAVRDDRAGSRVGSGREPQPCDS
jgi:O-antigen/teichoic acid export membrane protein